METHKVCSKLFTYFENSLIILGGYLPTHVSGQLSSYRSFNPELHIHIIAIRTLCLKFGPITGFPKENDGPSQTT